MMLCPKCHVEMKRTSESYQYRESGLDNVWLEDCPVFMCGPCGLPSIGMVDPDRIEREIVRRLVVQPNRLDGPSILFCRKAMGLTGSALASTLVEKEIVRRLV